MPMNGSLDPDSEAPGLPAAAAGFGPTGATPGDDPTAPPSGLGVPTGEAAGAAGAAARGGAPTGATPTPPCGAFRFAAFGDTINVAGADFDAGGVSLCPQFPQNRAATSSWVPH